MKTKGAMSTREAVRKAFDWVCRLCEQGVPTEMDYSGRSLKSQMKRADRLATDYVLIVGDKELKEGAAILRNMQTKDQVSIALEAIVDSVRRIVTAGKADKAD